MPGNRPWPGHALTDEPRHITYGLVTAAELDALLGSLDGCAQETISKPFLRFRLSRLAASAAAKPVSLLANALKKNRNPKPLHSLLRIVRKRYACFAIVEHPYFDLEEWSNYASFYSRSFTPYARACSRFHFIEKRKSNGGRIDAEEDSNKGMKFVEALNQHVGNKGFLALLEDAGLRYRGFMVLRATENFAVGRTAIEFDTCDPKASTIELHRFERHGTPFATASISSHIHVGGSKIVVFAPPFIQQCPAVGMCATASVWVACQILAHRFGLHKFAYDAITRQAKALPAAASLWRNEWKFGHGLTVPEVCEALTWTGASPLVVMPGAGTGESAQARMRLLLYTYVESGLPVILHYRACTGSHAVTLVGHLLPRTNEQVAVSEPSDAAGVAEHDAHRIFAGRSQATGIEHSFLGAACQLYYAQNDAHGPYDRICVVSDQRFNELRMTEPANSLVKETDKGCLLEVGREGKDVGALTAAIVALPPYVQNKPDRIMPDAISRFDYFYRKHGPSAGSPEGSLGPTRVLWRCMLASVGDFRESVLSRPFSDELRARYMALHLPLYVWLVEFTVLPASAPLPLGADRRVSGEFIYDSTTPYFEPTCMAFRFENCFKEWPDLEERPDALPNPNGEVLCFRADNGASELNEGRSEAAQQQTVGTKS